MGEDNGSKQRSAVVGVLRGSLRDWHDSQLPVGPTGISWTRHTPARFPPSLWNVRSATLNGGGRTNNTSEGWNNRLRSLVVHQHPCIWRLIEAPQADAAESSAMVIRHAVGNLSPRPASRDADAATRHKRL